VATEERRVTDAQLLNKNEKGSDNGIFWLKCLVSDPFFFLIFSLLNSLLQRRRSDLTFAGKFS
ncbi:hypothetical protein ACWW4L_004410, partial [Escherichia coli]